MGNLPCCGAVERNDSKVLDKALKKSLELNFVATLTSNLLAETISKRNEIQIDFNNSKQKRDYQTLNLKKIFKNVILPYFRQKKGDYVEFAEEILQANYMEYNRAPDDNF